MKQKFEIDEEYWKWYDKKIEKEIINDYFGEEKLKYEY